MKIFIFSLSTIRGVYQWVEGDNDFEYIFSNDVLVIPDPRCLPNHEEYKAYFSTDMLSTSTNGEWFACFGISQKNEGAIIAGNIQLDQLLHLKKHFTIKNHKKQYLQIKILSIIMCKHSSRVEEC